MFNNIADIADKFTRNEIMSANEVRSLIGMKPSQDPKADDLRNSNMPVEDTEGTMTRPSEEPEVEELEELDDELES